MAWTQERLNWHIEKMELMLRLLDNDNLSYEDIKSIQARARPQECAAPQP